MRSDEIIFAGNRSDSVNFTEFCQFLKLRC